MTDFKYKYNRLLEKHKDQTRLLKNVQLQLEQERVKNNVTLGSVSNCYDESDMRYVFECFDSGDTFENQIKEFNAPI